LRGRILPGEGGEMGGSGEDQSLISSFVVSGRIGSDAGGGHNF
jgi:hypothetical protein